MAASGIILLLFVIGHMVGNLQVFLGREAINRYGYFLQHTQELLWPARFVMLTTVLIHIITSIQLTRENRAARPVQYTQFTVVASTLASRTMLLSGLMVACFIIYHILHFTTRVPATNFTGQDFHHLLDDQGRHDIYAMMILGFKNPIASAFYIAGVGLLCMHISHGAGSMLQSLGIGNRGLLRFLERAATVIAIVLFLGYSSMPVAALLGLLKL